MGAGVFVTLGLGEQIAGPSILLALALAAVVAIGNGLSSAQLAANHPLSGGTYEYGHRWLTPSLGFTAGWMFLCAKAASAATAALGFAMYLAPDYMLPVSLATVAGLTVITLTGMQLSNAVNAVIVSAVLLTLLAFVAVGAPALRTKGELLQPFFDANRVLELFEATARVTESSKVPAAATLLVSAVIAGLVCIGDVKLTWSFSAFTVLIYYAVTNLCAIRLKTKERLYPAWISYLGLLSCLSLAFFVEWRVILTGLALIVFGLVWNAVAARG